jgi:lysyl-tRNA synthetase class 2
MRLAAFAERARMLRAVREHFAASGALEVATPILSAAGNSDPNIESFVTSYDGPKSAGVSLRYLRTSPEFPLKRLLAAGIGDCFEVGAVFRNGEFGRRHNPEFTMLEWYRVGADLDALMADVEALVAAVCREFSVPLGAFERISYRDLFRQALDIDPWSASDEALSAAAAGCDIDPAGLTRDDCLDVLRSHRIEPAFAPDAARFVYHFPPGQAALARVERVDGMAVAQRFELFLGSFEIANGYDELADADEQRQRFLTDLARRRDRGLPVPALDERLLAALPAMPACSGVALGVDRLHQWLIGADDLSSVAPLRFDLA